MARALSGGLTVALCCCLATGHAQERLPLPATEIQQVEPSNNCESTVWKADICEAGAEVCALPGREGWQCAQRTRPLRVNNELRTDTGGKLRVYVKPTKQLIEMCEKSRTRVKLGLAGDTVDFAYITDGCAQLTKVHGRTRNTVMQATATTFVVIYHPDDVVTEVVGVDGIADVGNMKGGATVRILAREYTRVVRDEPPTPPRFLDDTEYQRYVKPFAFIGRGRPESLAVENALLLGDYVPDPDRAPVTDPPAITDDSPWWTGERPFEQPPAAVSSTDLGINF